MSCLPSLQTPTRRDIHKGGVGEGRVSFKCRRNQKPMQEYFSAISATTRTRINASGSGNEKLITALGSSIPTDWTAFARLAASKCSPILALATPTVRSAYESAPELQVCQTDPIAEKSSLRVPARCVLQKRVCARVRMSKSQVQ